MSHSTQSPPDHGANNHFSDQARSTARQFAERGSEVASDAARHFVREPAKDLLSLAKEYASEKPDVVACWVFAAGILVGWRLKP